MTDDDGGGSAAGEGPAAPRAFPVRFTPGIGQAGPLGPTNSFRLHGRGTLELEAEQVVLRGRQGAIPGLRQEVEIAVDRRLIVDVLRTGREVRFATRPTSERGRAGVVMIIAADEAAAEAIAANLPQERTPEFEREAGELNAFRETLDRLAPRAVVTPALVAINLLVFVAMAVEGAGILTPNGAVHARWGSNVGPLTINGEWWRLFTCLFLHFGVVHLGFNLWALNDSGPTVERLFGSAHFLVLYLLSGVVGGMTSLLWDPAVNSAGASGAIFGIFGGLLAFVTRSGSRVPRTVLERLRTSTLLFVAYSLFSGFSRAGIDNAAHVGGLVAGSGLGFLLARPLGPERRAGIDTRRLGTAVASAAAALVLTGVVLQHGGLRPGPEQRFAVDATWLLVEERRLAARVEEWRQEPPGGRDAAQAAAALDSLVAAPWERAYARMAAHPLDERSGLRPRQELMLAYIASRRDGYRLLVEGVRNDDTTLSQRAGEKFQEGNQILERLARLIDPQ